MGFVCDLPLDNNGCNANIYIDDWVMSGMSEIGAEYSSSEWLDFFIPHVLSSGDTMAHSNVIHAYQWSDGCHSDNSVRAILLLGTCMASSCVG